MDRVRKIIEIDEDLCNGCGKCIMDCAEGALKIVDGKAKLISDNLCDGLGACMGGCPTGALKIIERQADEFDEEAVHEHLSKKDEKRSCPSLKMTMSGGNSGGLNWPVQISLVSEMADIFKNGDILVAADCVPSVAKEFHGRILGSKKLLIGCPKLDDQNFYIEKFARIFKANDLASLTLARMEVPCCGGMEFILKKAVELSGKNMVIDVVVVSRTGETIKNYQI